MYFRYFSSIRRFSASKFFRKDLDGVSVFRKNKPNIDLLFGVEPVLAALNSSKRTFTSILLSESAETERNQILEEAKRRNVPVSYVSRDFLDSSVNNRQHQGVLMRASPIVVPEVSSWDELTKKYNETSLVDRQDRNYWLVIDRVTDPMNFGSLLRSGWFLGCKAVIIPTKDSCSLTPVVSKASSGAMEHVPIYKTSNLSKLLLMSRKSNTVIFSTSNHQTNGKCAVVDLCHPASSSKLAQLMKGKETVLVFGNESNGISSDILDKSDLILTVSPNANTKSIDSLNVGVCGGIAMFCVNNSTHFN